MMVFNSCHTYGDLIRRHESLRVIFHQDKLKGSTHLIHGHWEVRLLHLGSKDILKMI